MLYSLSFSGKIKHTVIIQQKAVFQDTEICLYDLVYTLGGKKIKNYYLKCTAFEMHYFLQLVNFLSTENCFTVLAPSGWLFQHC